MREKNFNLSKYKAQKAEFFKQKLCFFKKKNSSSVKLDLSWRSIDDGSLKQIRRLKVWVWDWVWERLFLLMFTRFASCHICNPLGYPLCLNSTWRRRPLKMSLLRNYKILFHTQSHNIVQFKGPYFNLRTKSVSCC